MPQGTVDPFCNGIVFSLDQQLQQKCQNIDAMLAMLCRHALLDLKRRQRNRYFIESAFGQMTDGGSTCFVVEPGEAFIATKVGPKEMRIEAVLIGAQNKQPTGCDRTHTPIANNAGLADGA